MKNLTQKEIAHIAKMGLAEDITTASAERLQEIRNGAALETIATAHGVHGRNAQLIRDNNSGKLYAITARTSNIFWMI